MSNGPQYQPQGVGSPEPQPPKGSNLLLWIGGFFVLMIVLVCGGGVVGLAYIGVVSPETSVYVGNRIPNRYVEMAEEVGAIETGERIQFFYSDALLDARDGFSLVTDSKVSVYTNDGREDPLEVIEFDEISSAEIIREESFITDSQILLELKNGDFVAFPVSSEYDRDESFFELINKNVQ